MAGTKKPIKGFGERLYESTYGLDVNMADLSRKTQISRSLIWAYIYDGKVPSSSALMKLCAYLNVSADYLLFGKKQNISVVDLYEWAKDREFEIELKTTEYGISIKASKDNWSVGYLISDDEISETDVVLKALVIIQDKIGEITE